MKMSNSKASEILTKTTMAARKIRSNRRQRLKVAKLLAAKRSDQVATRDQGADPTPKRKRMMNMVKKMVVMTKTRPRKAKKKERKRMVQSTRQRREQGHRV